MQLEAIVTSALSEVLGQRLKSSKGDLTRTMQSLTDAVVARARSEASGDLVGVVSGAYRASIRGQVIVNGDEIIGRVFSADRKGHWIEYGTKRRGHVSLPTSAEVLIRAAHAGRAAAAPMVNHPYAGMAARFVLHRALGSMGATIVEQAAGVVVREMVG